MNTPVKSIHFSIAESDYYFKEILIKSLLGIPFFRMIKNCNNGYELVNQLYYRNESVFLIDLFMPIMSGLEVIKHIRQTGNQTPIITYSAVYQEDMFAMLDKLPHVFYCEKKSTVIIHVLNNFAMSSKKNKYEEYLKEWEMQPRILMEHMQRQRKAWYDPSLIEVQIMKLCYEGLSNKEIGQYLNLSTRTIDSYILRLTQKLGLRNKIDLIRFCVEHGYYNSSS